MYIYLRISLQFNNYLVAELQSELLSSLKKRSLVLASTAAAAAQRHAEGRAAPYHLFSAPPLWALHPNP